MDSPFYKIRNFQFVKATYVLETGPSKRELLGCRYSSVGRVLE